MNSKERNYRIAYETLIILAAITLLSFVCRLWPIIILTLLGMIFAAIRMLCLKAKQTEPETAVQVSEEPQKEPKIQDLYQLAYALILERISTLVASEYESAKWVWETPDAKKRIENGEEVFILLNEAGGYRRAKVVIVALRVIGLEYLSMTEPDNADETAESEEKNPEDTSGDTEKAEAPKENYELIAFEWADSHMMELNARCNEAVGNKQDSVILGPEELPVKESWEHIRNELIRAELTDVECGDDGIIIYLNRKNSMKQDEKGNENHGCMD